MKSPVWLVLAFVQAPAGHISAQGTIIYHQPSVPISPLIGRQLDLDGDGQIDLRFYDGSYQPPLYSATAASGVGSAKLLVTPQGPNDLGSYLVALSSGFEIGGSLSPSLLWAAHDAPNQYGDATVLGTYLPNVGSFVPDGFFYGTTAFMGIQFQIGSDWHYGWVRIRGGVAGPSDDGQQFYLNPPGWILDWAYESRADTPVFAGAVPEPSAGILAGLGFVVLLIQRWRKLA
ncbi:MAG: hypothetical protein KJ070_25075 [Verrucomicrobia bacterium]|nr:hypothetical protein [Verrucomicrobiota bacterium]